MKNILLKLTALITLLTSITQTCPRNQHTQHEAIIEINSKEQLKNIMTTSQGPILISLFMNHCGACQAMQPILEKLSKDTRFHDIMFYEANGPEIDAPEIVLEKTNQQIPGYPFIIFMHKGKYVDKQVGYTNQEEMGKKLNRLRDRSHRHSHHYVQ